MVLCEEAREAIRFGFRKDKLGKKSWHSTHLCTKFDGIQELEHSWLGQRRVGDDP
jgi:hypothetical protein